MRRFVVWLCWFLAAGAFAQDVQSWRPSTQDEQRLDAAAFGGFDDAIATALKDVQSVVVVIQGRKAYAFYRDGDADALRDTQSVTKSVLALLVGTALQREQLVSMDQPVVELMPAWRDLNPDGRSRTITLRHLLGMTTGFEIHDLTGRPGRWRPPRRGPDRLARSRGIDSPTTTASR